METTAFSLVSADVSISYLPRQAIEIGIGRSSHLFSVGKTTDHREPPEEELLPNKRQRSLSLRWRKKFPPTGKRRAYQDHYCWPLQALMVMFICLMSAGDQALRKISR